jgi:hypothetical protein
VCSALARRGWAAALTRDGVERTDIWPFTLLTTNAAWWKSRSRPPTPQSPGPIGPGCAEGIGVGSRMVRPRLVAAKPFDAAARTRGCGVVHLSSELVDPTRRSGRPKKRTVAEVPSGAQRLAGVREPVGPVAETDLRGSGAAAFELPRPGAGGAGWLAAGSSLGSRPAGVVKSESEGRVVRAELVPSDAPLWTRLQQPHGCSDCLGGLIDALQRRQPADRDPPLPVRRWQFRVPQP